RRSASARWLEVAVKRASYHRADLVTAVSRGLADQLAGALGLGAHRIRVVYNPVVPDDVSVRAAEPVDHPWFAGSIPVVVACGRLVKEKDYPTLLAAFRQISARRPARLVILGDGPDRENVEALAGSLGLSPAVHFAGFQANPWKYFARSRVLLHASRAEGLPGALIQAMACGTPVVSTDCD